MNSLRKTGPHTKAYRAVLYGCIVFFLAVKPVPRELYPGVSGLDKVAHLFIYGVLAVLVLTAMPRRWGMLRYGVSVVIATGYGVLMEIVQYFLPYRGCDSWDMVANLVGAVVGVVVYAIVMRGRRFRSP